MSEKSAEQSAIVPIDTGRIRELVYTIRGVQVMLDADLARLYQVETRILNRNVARNISRFPEDFRFQLTKDEFENLKSQIGISNDNEHGGRRNLPYAYTEQGISMLSGVLRSDVAIEVSIGIMRAFVEMRRFIAGNAHMFERIERVELKQLLSIQHPLPHVAVLNENSNSLFADSPLGDSSLQYSWAITVQFSEVSEKWL